MSGLELKINGILGNNEAASPACIGMSDYKIDDKHRLTLPTYLRPSDDGDAASLATIGTIYIGESEEHPYKRGLIVPLANLTPILASSIGQLLAPYTELKQPDNQHRISVQARMHTGLAREQDANGPLDVAMIGRRWFYEIINALDTEEALKNSFNSFKSNLS